MRASLKLTLSGLFALLLLAAALQGGFAIHRMIALDSQLAALLDHAVLSMNEAQAIEALVIRSRLAQVRFVTAAAETGLGSGCSRRPALSRPVRRPAW